MQRRTFILAISALCAWAEENSWNKLRYRGGTVAVKLNPFDWNTTLSVGKDELQIEFGTRLKLKLKAARVSAIFAGPGAARRVEEAGGGGKTEKPPGLFGLLRGGKEDMIGIVFETEDSKPGAILLEADRRYMWAMLRALAAVTGKQVEILP